MNAAKHQYALFDFDLADGRCGEPIPARSDFARLQRATQGAEQSTTCGGDHVIECRRMRLGHLAFDPVMTGDRPMRSKTYGLRLDRQLRKPERP